MVALFVVLTVAVFLTIDLVLAARSQAGLSHALHLQRAAEDSARTRVAGFEIAPDRAYHPGHTWARLDQHAVARVGVDEFAARLIGPADKVELVEAGTSVRAGQVIARITRRGREAAIVAPIAGIVRSVNSRLATSPAKASHAPYDEGWLVEIKGRDLRRDLRTLRSGAAAQQWLDESVTALHRLFGAEGALPAAADGGRPVDAISDLMDDAAWTSARSQFLLGE